MILARHSRSYEIGHDSSILLAQGWGDYMCSSRKSGRVGCSFELLPAGEHCKYEIRDDGSHLSVQSWGYCVFRVVNLVAWTHSFRTVPLGERV